MASTRPAAASTPDPASSSESLPTEDQFAGTLPRQLLAQGVGDAPSLFAESVNGMPLGFIDGPIPVEVVGVPTDGRVRVNIVHAPFAVEGLYLDATQLAAYVQEPTVLEGTPIVLHRGDVVRVRGRGTVPDELRVAVEPYMTTSQQALGRWEGVLPTSSLGVERRPRTPEEQEQGDPVVIPNQQEIIVYDEPGGDELGRFTLRFRLGARARTIREGWHHLCFGRGACVLGWTDAALESVQPPSTTVGVLMGGSAGGNSGMGGLGLAGSGQSQSSAPRGFVEACRTGRVWRVAQGAELVWGRRRIAAITTTDAWACEVRRGTGHAFVTVMADDDIAMLGWIVIEALQSVE